MFEDEKLLEKPFQGKTKFDAVIYHDDLVDVKRCSRKMTDYLEYCMPKKKNRGERGTET